MTEPRPHPEAELIEFVRAIDARAPEELHRNVESLIAARSPGARRLKRTPPAALGAGRSRFGARLAGAVALAAVAGAVAAVLTGGSGSGLSAREASALTLRPATLPAPAESPRHNGQLMAAVDHVAFPYWEEHFGWRSTGARSDRLDGRAVTTVFYEDRHGRRLGYAIVAGTPALALNGGAVAWRGGVPFRLLTANGARVITWMRGGHLCVVSGRGIDGATLLRLASWSAHGSVTS
jgi:hypothetical protein